MTRAEGDDANTDVQTPETCAHGHPIGADCSVCTWFNLTPGYREAVLREHGLVPPWERTRSPSWLRRFWLSATGRSWEANR